MARRVSIFAVKGFEHVLPGTADEAAAGPGMMSTVSRRTPHVGRDRIPLRHNWRRRRLFCGNTPTNNHRQVLCGPCENIIQDRVFGLRGCGLVLMSGSTVGESAAVT